MDCDWNETAKHLPDVNQPVLGYFGNHQWRVCWMVSTQSKWAFPVYIGDASDISVMVRQPIAWRELDYPPEEILGKYEHRTLKDAVARRRQS